MGLNAIRCKELYTEAGKTGFGEEARTSSDFDGTDLLKSGAMLAMIAAGSFVTGCISISEEQPEKIEDNPVRLEYHNWGDRGIDAKLDAKTIGDKTTFHSDLTGADYKMIFKGIIPENGTLKAHFDIARKDPATGSVEKQHVALEDYLKPETHDEATSQYRQLVNGSTDSVASMNFEGNKNFADLKVFAYADIKNDKEVDLNLAEGVIKQPLECRIIVVPVYGGVAPMASCSEPKKLEENWGEN